MKQLGSARMFWARLIYFPAPPTKYWLQFYTFFFFILGDFFASATRDSPTNDVIEFHMFGSYTFRVDGPVFERDEIMKNCNLNQS